MDPGILPALAGIGMSFAGFAGLFGALRQRSGDWQPIEVHMVQGIVTSGFAVLLLALVPIPLAGIFGQIDAVRIASALLFATTAVIGFRQTRRGRRFSTGAEGRARGLAFAFVGVPAIVVMPLAAFSGRLDLYEFSLVVLLLVPIIVFSFVLEDLGKPHP